MHDINQCFTYLCSLLLCGAVNCTVMTMMCVSRLGRTLYMRSQTWSLTPTTWSASAPSLAKTNTATSRTRLSRTVPIRVCLNTVVGLVLMYGISVNVKCWFVWLKS